VTAPSFSSSLFTRATQPLQVMPVML
jgi:hypothetical protein